MKKILYLICVICLIFVFSCSKKVENHSNIENDFGGEKSDEIEVALSPEEIEKQKYENAHTVATEKCRIAKRHCLKEKQNI